MAHIVEKEDIKVLLKYITFLVKYYEEDERYEVCQELLEFSQKLSDYVLGYIDFVDVQEDLYNFCVIEGRIDSVDIFSCSVVFEIYANGQKYFFDDISLMEISRLLDIKEEQSKLEIGKGDIDYDDLDL